MTTIVINENTEEGRSLMNVIRVMRKSSDAVVRIYDDGEHIPGLPYTHEELMEDIRCSEEDIIAGRTITNNALRKEITTWK